MRKILLCLCFVFAVGLLFSACGKDDKKQNPAPKNDVTSNDVTTNAPPELIPQGKEEEAAEEKVKIEASDDLQALAAEQGITFEISELVFGTEPHRIRGNETDPIVVENGKNYSFMFGLKIVGGDLDGMTIYQYIDVSGAEWTLAENAAVTKDDKGFKVKDDFYAEDGNVTVTVNIRNYKHLPSKQFTFVLKSKKLSLIVGTWKHIYSDDLFLTFRDDGSGTLRMSSDTRNYQYEYNVEEREIIVRFEDGDVRNLTDVVVDGNRMTFIDEKSQGDSLVTLERQ